MEDILHQDPREKLELFPGLGYYFVVFRALESERSRERFRQFRSQSGAITGLPGDDDVIGAVNVYLVVFREGICSVRLNRFLILLLLTAYPSSTMAISLNIRISCATRSSN